MHGSQERNTRRRRAERQVRKAVWAERRLPCVRCGQPIDYTLPPQHPDAVTDEHILPWSTYPELRDDPANHGPSHARCNKGAGNRPSLPELGSTSEVW